MPVYLPIAEVSVDVFVILLMGGGVGFLSGLFGVGGGFLMTPLLIFLGISLAVAVGTASNQIIAASASAVFAHMRRGNVDFKMGAVLTVGGFAGSTLGVEIFTLLREVGQVDLAVQLCYVLFLGVIGLLMAVESGRALLRHNTGAPSRGKLHRHTWLHGLPWKVRFRRSRLYISAFLPLAAGFLVGILGAVMGVGGGFLIIPIMIYLLGMPTAVVVGTSLFQIIFVMANVTFLRGEQLRGLLALIVLAVCGKVAFDLVVTPADLFSIVETSGFGR